MTSNVSGAQVTPGKLVGQRVKRKEDPRLIRGQATYVDDLQLPGMLHLAFKRSDLAHGKILNIDTSAAEAMPGVVMVATGADLKERLAPMPVITPFPKPDHWPITWDKVRFVGDPIAVVVAHDRYLARDAVDAIRVEIEALPAVIDPERAMQGEPALVHDDTYGVAHGRAHHHAEEPGVALGLLALCFPTLLPSSVRPNPFRTRSDVTPRRRPSPWRDVPAYGRPRSRPR